jgi:hypothetical protein
MDIATQTRDPADECLAPGRGSRQILRGIIGAAAIAVFAGAMVGPASAAPGDTDTHSTDAHVGVTSAIALTGLTTEFTLTGLPGATVTGLGAVTFTVTTNNIGGYAVSVLSETEAMVAATPGNTNVIPIGSLGVRESGTDDYSGLDDTAPTTVHSQDTRSDVDGDALSNDYRLVVPFVNEDTYTATLDYLATTL